MAVGLSLLLFVAVAWVDYLPTGDGPQHIFIAYVTGHIGDLDRGWARYLDAGAATTGAGFSFLLGLLDRVLPWRLAFRLSVAALAVAWAWSVMALAAGLGPRRRWLGLLGFATALQWQFYMGLFSYYLATGIGFWALAFALQRKPWRARDTLLLAALLALEAVSHVVAAALTGMTLGVLALLSAPVGARLRACVRTGLACVPAILLALIAFLEARSGAPSSQYTAFAAPLAQASLLGRAFVSGPAWRAWPPVGLALVGLLYACRWRRNGMDANERALSVAAGILLLLALFTPLHVKGWEYFNVRFIPSAILFFALLVPVERLARPRWRIAACVLLVSYAVTAIAWGWAHNLSIRRAYADILAGVDAPIRRQGPRLPIVVEPPPGEPADEWARSIPFVGAHWHMNALYALQQGGVPAYLFAGAGGIHPLSWLEPPAGLPMPAKPVRGYEWQLWTAQGRADPTIRRRALTSLLSFGPGYEDVIFYGLPSDHAILRERGFQADFERGGALIARFVGCPGRLEIHQPEDGPTATWVLAGWWPDARPTFSLAIPAQAALASQTVPLDHSPCGDIWVRVLFDRDGDGKLSPGDRTCRGANENAVIRHRLGPGADTVVCWAAAPAWRPN